MRTRGTHFGAAAASAVITALNIADYDGGALDTLLVALGTIATIAFFIMGLRAGKPKG